jgi:hypothetical protein
LEPAGNPSALENNRRIKFFSLMLGMRKYSRTVTGRKK